MDREKIGKIVLRKFVAVNPANDLKRFYEKLQNLYHGQQPLDSREHQQKEVLFEITLFRGLVIDGGETGRHY